MLRGGYIVRDLFHVLNGYVWSFIILKQQQIGE